MPESTTNKEAFFNELNSSVKWDAGVAFARTNALPIDDKSVFPSIESLNSYAASGATKYPGQVVAVIEDDATTHLYVINADGTVSEIAGGLVWQEV